MSADHSCFVCGWNKIDAPTQSEEVDLSNLPTVIGTCWGYIKERGVPMEIKAIKRQDGAYVADVGCKKWRGDKADFAALMKASAPIEETL